MIFVGDMLVLRIDLRWAAAILAHVPDVFATTYQNHGTVNVTAVVISRHGFWNCYKSTAVSAPVVARRPETIETN
jgi:hypothetical protein